MILSAGFQNKKGAKLLKAKTWMIMKLTIALLLFFTFQVSAKTHAQRITIIKNNIHLAEVFKAIEQQTGFLFFYDKDMIQKTAPIDVDLKDATLEQALSACLKSQRLTFTIVKNTVVIQRQNISKPAILQLANVVSLTPPVEIHGRIVNQKGEPLSNVSVLVAGTKIGTTTNSDGSFTLTTSNDKNIVLEFSSIGYQTKTVKVGKQTEINVTLELEVSGLNEVVVVGYGSARKRDLTGAVTSIKTDDITQSLNMTPSSLIQDKVPGMEVTANSGAPGATPTIQIRGTSSIRSSNNPLYVVDGVPLDGVSVSPSLNNSFGTTPQTDPLLFINPNDIAQIDVLKDASATAIYGSRGANGVIIITTKKGQAGPTKVDFGIREGLFAGYMKRFKILNTSQFRSALKKYLPDSVSSMLDGGANTDALKAITQNKVSQNYSLSISGGDDKGTYRASFLGTNDQGFLKNSSLYKYLGSFSGHYNFFDKKLTIGFNVATAHFGVSGVSIGQTSGNNGNLLISALEWNPTQPLKINGAYNWPTTGGAGQPLAFADAYSDLSNVSEILSNITVTYKIFPKLTYTFQYGINHGTGDRKINADGWLRNFLLISGSGNASIATQTLTSQVVDHLLNYQAHIIEGLNMDATLGFEYYKTDIFGSSVTGSHFNTNLDYDNRIDIPYTSLMQDALVQTPYTTFNNPISELQSYFGRVNFNYLDKYLLTGTLRSDGSSKFGKNNKYGYFPSVGFKWQIANEKFMKESKVFSNLGLRLSYGITGNQEFPAGSSQEQFSLTTYNNAPQVVNGNPNLKWESTKQINAGLDFAFGSTGRIYGSVDYYKKNTSDILFQTNAIQPAPSSLSFINLPNAHLFNSGVEVALGIALIQNNNITWDINGNVAYNKNIIKNFTDPNSGLDLLIQTGNLAGQGLSGTLAQVITNNKPVDEFYLKKFEGFDKDGNQIISSAPGFAGDPNPHVLVGFNTSLRYNKFTFDIRMGGAFGYLIYNTTRNSITNIAGIAQGRNIDLAAYNSKELPSSGVAASTRFLESGNYFKLRNATISYSVGNAGKYIKNINVYITGSNLFVITKFTGFDPEVNVDESNNSYPSRSIEFVPYPTARSISFGLNFTL